MRVRILSTTFFTWLILSLISCENIEEDPVINAEDYYGDGSYFIELARLKSPEIQERFCGNVQVFELRSRSDLSEFGTTTVYSDGLNLVFQFNLHQNRIIEGWRIDETFVWVGLAEDWLYGRKGPSGGWRNYPGITVVGHHTLPVMGNHEVPLENWMFDDCIVVAARLTARFPNGNGMKSRYMSPPN